jgi:hypothetical protein
MTNTAHQQPQKLHQVGTKTPEPETVIYTLGFKLGELMAEDTTTQALEPEARMNLAMAICQAGFELGQALNAKRPSLKRIKACMHTARTLGVPISARAKELVRANTRPGCRRTS